MCPFISAAGLFFCVCAYIQTLVKCGSKISNVFCSVIITDQSDDSDQTKLVVGVVVGLLVATVVIGLAYWVYMKKSK